jgi:hypothetical protein
MPILAFKDFLGSGSACARLTSHCSGGHCSGGSAQWAAHRAFPPSTVPHLPILKNQMAPIIGESVATYMSRYIHSLPKHIILIYARYTGQNTLQF